MKLPLKEPLSAKYLYIEPENTVHIFMPIVSGTHIGLDNTCKAVYALQEFFDKGSHSNKKNSLKAELLAYKEALESDIILLGMGSPLGEQKQEKLAQIDANLKVLAFVEKHPELNCLNTGFPSYPRPLEELMQDRTNSNLYSMVLCPTEEDGFLRSEAANPLFSVAHKSVSKQIQASKSELQQALIQAYTRLTFKASDLKSQVIQQVLAQLKYPHVPLNFEHLRKILHETVLILLNIDVDFTKTQQGSPIHQQEIDNAMGFNPQTTNPTEYMEALFGYCAGNLFDTIVESPFNRLTQAEPWSIATQFLLGITNLYCVSRGIISPDTNFGQILDKRGDLSKEFAQTVAKAQKDTARIEEACLLWINAHAKEFKLKTSFSTEDMDAIQQDFANRYAQIKDSPHFDEFFILDTQRKGDFVIHQGSICTSFAKFVSSPLLDVPQELTQPLEKARGGASHLGVTIPHKNLLVQDEVVIDTTILNNDALQALYERINTYKDPKLKEQLLAQVKHERPDFKPQINAKQFLQHVAYGEQNEAENLLKKDVDSAQVLLTARKIPFTDYSGRTFKCTAYEYAYWAKDTHMCRMLEKYMDDHTKHSILQRVQKIEEFIGDPLKQPRGLAYTQNGKAQRSAHFDLTPLKKALSTYIEAYKQGPKATDADWEALNALWIKVGLPQREVPAHIAQEYCHPKRSFYHVVHNKALLDASNKTNLERQLQFYNWEGPENIWFTPKSAGENSGLGFSWAILRAWGGPVGCGGRAAAGTGLSSIDLSAIEALDEVRTKDLKQSLENLAAPSNLKTPVVHGS
ncbi:SidC homolog [Legionella sainthelensi]|uniref:SidC n=1 Tax=Legionella sainthelensi TaxID=28087 RepID=UPI000F6B56D6|nr:SidC [Legionella sainthelensi]VEB36325.1 SidC homolog [Legionella sainthelensi]